MEKGLWGLFLGTLKAVLRRINRVDWLTAHRTGVSSFFNGSVDAFDVEDVIASGVNFTNVL
jgi:hypothetical protein